VRSSRTEARSISDVTASQETPPSGILDLASTEWIADGFVPDPDVDPGTASSWKAVATGVSLRTLTSARAFLVPHDGASAWFEAWLSGLDVRGVARVSLDGVTWHPLQVIEPSDGWMPVVLDLEAWRGEAVLLQFVFEAAPVGRSEGGDSWRIRLPGARVP
jgi:hypothetical protein